MQLQYFITTKIIIIFLITMYVQKEIMTDVNYFQTHKHVINKNTLKIINYMASFNFQNI